MRNTIKLAALLLAVAAPARAAVDLQPGETRVVSAEVEFVFRAGTAGSILLPSAAPLEGMPAVDAPAGLRVAVLDVRADAVTAGGTVLSPSGYRSGPAIVGSGIGYRIRCRVELAAEAGLGEGGHEVTLSFPAVTSLVRSLGQRR